MDAFRRATTASRPEVPDGHALIAAGLAARGITHVFGIGGTPVHETLAACVKAGIRVVGVHHQQAAPMMAASHNYVTGRLAAAVVLSAGPAITNAVTGVLVAHDNDWPLLVLGGCRALGARGTGTFQDLDAVAIFRSITRYADLIESPASIAPILDRACAMATGGRPGPVYLDVPEETLDGTAAASAASPRPPPVAPAIDRAAIDRVATLLIESRRPSLLVGGALRWSASFSVLSRLVERLDLPFAATPIAQGFLPDDHRLCFNAVRARMLSTADVVLLAGARLDWTLRFGAEIAKGAKVIVLGTDEHGPGGLVAPTLSIAGDSGAVLEKLILAIGPAADAARAPDSWRADLVAARDEHMRHSDALARDDRVPMGEHRLIAEVRRFLPRDGFFVVDGNRILDAAQRLMPTCAPVARLTPGHNGCMGVGVPFGIGAKLAHPERTVVVVTGDLAFGLTVMEMETAVRLRVPVIVVVANNDGNGGGLSERKFYPSGHPDRITLFQPGIRYDSIVRALGGHGEHVEHPDELVPALERAAASGVASCIDVRMHVHVG